MCGRGVLVYGMPVQSVLVYGIGGCDMLMHVIIIYGVVVDRVI